MLAGLGLLTGEVIPHVSKTHKSPDFIELLKKLDAKYPEGDNIRIFCDNNSAHKSREIRNYLATRQMLRGIRVKSKQEPMDRIYLYLEEVNR